MFTFCLSQTIISGIWNDDFAIDTSSGLNGWTINKNVNKSCGPERRYHGVFADFNDILQRSFTCDNGVTNQRYYVTISFGIGYDPCAETETTIKLQVNSTDIATYQYSTRAITQTNPCFDCCGCSGNQDVFHLQKWNNISVSSISNITSSDTFNVGFHIVTESSFETVIYGITIECNRLTNTTSQSSNQPTNQSTDQPSNQSVNQPSLQPTIDLSLELTLNPTQTPSNIPAENPTIMPSIIPTIVPIATIIPTPKPIELTITSTIVLTTTKENAHGVDEDTTIFIDTLNTKDVSSADGFLLTGTILLYAMFLIIFILLCICIILVIIYLKKRQKQTQSILPMELGRVKSGNLDTVLPDTNGLDYATHAIDAEPDISSKYVALQHWLAKIGCMEYYDIFIQNGFGDNMSTLSRLNDNDLINIGIKKIAFRKQMLLQIENDKNLANNLNINDINGFGYGYGVGDTVNLLLSQTVKSNVILRDDSSDDDLYKDYDQNKINDNDINGHDVVIQTTKGDNHDEQLLNNTLTGE